MSLIEKCGQQVYFGMFCLWDGLKATNVIVYRESAHREEEGPGPVISQRTVMETKGGRNTKKYPRTLQENYIKMVEDTFALNAIE